jgi:glutamate racemase
MIALYDSGLGGLSVLREVQALLPGHELLYLADSAYCPYGPRADDQVRTRARACARWLLGQGAELLVVACNTATSAALEQLRAMLPIPVVGMEPGIKPAVAATRNGIVGVLATGGTLGGTRFADLVRRFAGAVEIRTVPCPGLVECVEAGYLDGARPRSLLAGYLEAIGDADTLVLGCTHFPFLAPLIARLAGPHVTLIDTGPAVAHRVAVVAAEGDLLPSRELLRCYTTGEPRRYWAALQRMLPDRLREVVLRHVIIPTA